MATRTNLLLAALKATLEGNLPALLTAEGLDAITAFITYDPGRSWKSFAPQVWIDVVSDTTENMAAEGLQDRTLEFLVGVTAKGDDASATATRLRAHTDLIKRALEANPTLGGVLTLNQDDLEVLEAAYGDNEGVSGQYLQESVRRVRIVVSETEGE
jgi:hypothetical protein